LFLQIKRSGKRVQRKVIVEEDRGMLLLFNMDGKLQRQLPLTQLVQVLLVKHTHSHNRQLQQIDVLDTCTAL
jgi:hypothetical protein